MGGPKTRKHFAVEDRLPQGIKAQVDRLLIEGATYKEVADFLTKSGHDISHSALGRYGKNFLEAYRAVRMLEDQAQALKSEAGEGLVLEEAASKLFAQKIVEGLTTKKLALKNLPGMLGAFAKLQSSSVQRERLKADLSAKAKKAVENIEKKTRKKNMDPETKRIIREEIYGIVR